jgi:fibronectin-binding autotransporter adhesin
VFQGTAGDVTVEGAQRFTGLQFATDGYRLLSGTAGQLTAINGVGDRTAVRVDPDVIATIGVGIDGAGTLAKLDSGTLVLNGANSYTGGTSLEGGKLVVGSDTAVGTGALNTAAGTSLDSNTAASLGNAVALTGDLTIDGSNALTLTGVVGGTGGLIKNGAATLTLNGSNSYTGGTTLNTGTLTVGNADALGTGSLTVVGASTLDSNAAVALNNGVILNAGLIVGGSNDLTLGGVVSGGGGLTKNGAATLTLNGGNSYVGGTTLNTGTLVLGNAAALGTGALTLGGASTLDNTLAMTLNNGVTLNAGLTLGGSNDLTLAGAVEGVGGLTKNGAAALTLTGSNSYQGATQVVTGTLLAGASDALPAGSALTIGSGATFDLNGFDVTTGSLAGAGVVALASSRLTAGGDNTSTTFSGNLTGGPDGGLTKTGNGTLSLSGTSSFSGQTDIQAGTVAIGNGQSLGTGTVSLQGGKLLGTADLTMGNAVALNNAGSTVAAAAGTQFDSSGALSLASNIEAVFGSTTDTGTVLLNSSGIESGINNTLRVAGGTLKAGNEQLGILTGGALVSTTVDAGATLDFNGIDAGVVRLLGAGTVQTGTDASKTLALQSGNFSGNIQGAGNVDKTTDGTLALSGSNSYSGATHINAGTLLVNGDQSAATGAVTVANGATLGGSGTLGGAVTVENGGHLGSGSVPATLATGAMSLNPTSQLDFKFGQAGVAGGPLNDLVNVNGNLVLDGQLNVTTPAEGTFATGLYRVFNYTGGLTDHTLDIASAPGGTAGLSIQTATAGQVNLVNAVGVNLQYWDPVQGTPGAQGGAGIWQGSAGNNNWNNDGVSANRPFASGAFALFTGTGGAVTVDSTSYGPINVSGMQFDADGYVLNGGTLQATTASTLVRVGAGGVGAGTTATINSIIADDNVTGGTLLTKSDAGTLVLGGANTYRGGTAVTAGTLQVSADNNLGAASGGLALDNGTLRYGAGFASARAVTLGDNGGGVDTNGNDAALNGAITGTGTGALTKSGAGTLTLAGANTYGGGTSVNAGTLQGNTTSLQGNIINNANVAFDQAANGTYAGSMTGSGSLTKLNAGTLTLTSAQSSFTGGTTVSGGTLQGTTDTLKGNIANNANVTFDQGDSGTYDGAMTGIGSLTKTGDGALTLTNNQSSYSGGTFINAGEVLGSSDAFKGNIFNNASLVFDQRTDSVYAGSINGTGGLTKIGSARVDLTGISNYTGATNVNGGTLSVNGSIANSDVTVNAGGILGGTGTVGPTTVASGGVFAPGNSIGTITVNGRLIFAAGSTYQVKTDAAGNADRINVVGAPGSATLNGGTVDVRAGSGTYQPVTQYTILNAAGGVGGKFANVTSDLAFLTPTLSYDPANVFLTLRRNETSYASIGVTPNQVATGGALQSAVAGAQGSTLALLTAVDNLSASQARGALGQLSGEIHASARTALLEDSRFVRDASLDRLRQAQGGGMSTTGMFVDDSAKDGHGNATWARVFGADGRIDGDGDASRLKRDVAGFLVGTDTLLTGGWRVGGLIGYSHSNMDVDGLGGSARADSYHLGVYGGKQWDATSLRLGASTTWSKLDTQRTVGFPGFANSLKSDDDISTTQVFGEVGHRIDMGTVAVEPFAGLAYVNVDAGKFSESGGAAALQGGGGSLDALFSTLGVRASTQLGDTTRLQGTVGWRHAFGGNTPTSTNSFATGSSFTVFGVPLAKDVAVLEAGVETQLRKDMTLGVSYAGQFGNGLKDHGLKVSLGWKF